MTGIDSLRAVPDRIVELGVKVRSELTPAYHVTPGGLLHAPSIDALNELIVLAAGASRTITLSRAIEIGARLAMSEGCPFTGVSGDFDACSSLTRQVYEERACEAFGVSLEDYYAMAEADE